MSTHLEIHIPNDRDRLYHVIKLPAGEIQVRLTDEGCCSTRLLTARVPCVDCARAIVAVGISELVYIIKPERIADPRYGFETSRAILEAGGMKLTEYKDAV